MRPNKAIKKIEISKKYFYIKNCLVVFYKKKVTKKVVSFPKWCK
ncbi:hypothetical protein NU09_2920 [Flavobacterium beibuense]|uniref:Uncharacterized protein n=1 Tax=Flavobacterium beibuense TaxID=657326 RepID=A0A444W797_9FLAO|nr:hypothetical protein NU09_2920 [Flavobacterium beibuense]